MTIVAASSKSSVPRMGCFALSVGASARVKTGLSTLASSPYEDVEWFEHESATVLRETLPTTCLEQVASLREGDRAAGALLIQGLPVDASLPPAPVQASALQQKPGHMSEACLLGFGRLLGRAYAFKAEKSGAIVHDVFPVPGRESERSNEGSYIPFNFHTEVAAHPASPDYVLLSCLRADCQHSAVTLVADVTRACAQLDTADLSALQCEEFELLSPQSFRGWRDRVVCRVLRRVGASFEARLNLNGMRALTERGRVALAHFAEALVDDRVVSAVHLQPGDLLLINNRRAVHGRSGFAPNYDGDDRWLQRIYVRRELWATTSNLVYPNRVIE